MSNNNTYRLTEIVGSSPDSIADAIRNGVERASKTLRNLDWFEVVSTRGEIADGKVAYFQATIKVGFKLDDES